LAPPIGVDLAPDRAVQRVVEHFNVAPAPLWHAAQRAGYGAPHHIFNRLVIVLDARQPLDDQFGAGENLAVGVDGEAYHYMPSERQAPAAFHPTLLGRAEDEPVEIEFTGPHLARESHR